MANTENQRMIKVSIDTSKVKIPDVKTRIGPALIAAGEYLRDKINVYPPPVKRPIQWESQKQKRYVLANVKPLPYRRQSHPKSRQLAKSFRLRLKNTSVEVFSLAPYASYVIGIKQQRFHKATGWVNVEDVVQREKQRVTDIVTKLLTR